jgi:hypothetical protein
MEYYPEREDRADTNMHRRGRRDALNIHGNQGGQVVGNNMYCVAISP